MADASNLYHILGVAKTASPEDIRAAYRTLAKRYHPDVDASKEDLFKKITAAYEVLSDPDKKAQYDRTGSTKAFSLKTKTSIYSIEESMCSGDLSDVFRATNSKRESVIIKISKDPGNNDLLENEARILKEIFPPTQVEEKKYRYLPRFIESLKLNDGKVRQVNILGDLQNFHSMVKIRGAFHDPTLMMEHGVWMFNRILEGLDFIHKEKKVVHGAILPPHVMIYSSGLEKDPYNHGAKLIDWSYAVKVFETVKAISPEYEDFYAPEILRKKLATPATDIYMAAKCIIYVLGGDVKNNILPARIPNYFASFLKGCTLSNPSYRGGDARKIHAELKEHMAKHYGPKKYVPFNMPAGA